jgi:hypothetical protein
MKIKLNKNIIGEYCKIKDLQLFQVEEPPMDEYIFRVCGYSTRKGKQYLKLMSNWLSYGTVILVPVSRVIMQY